MSKGGGSSGNTATTTTTQSPPPQYLQAYQNLTDRANAVSQAPLQQYTDPLVAGFTPQQTQGFQTIQNLQGSYVPYLNAAAQEFGQATQPIWSTLPSFDTSQLPQGALDRISQSSDFATKSGNLPVAEGDGARRSVRPRLLVSHLHVAALARGDVVHRGGKLGELEQSVLIGAGGSRLANSRRGESNDGAADRTP